MTVEALIRELQKMPPGARVVVNLGKNELANGREIGRVEIVEAVSFIDSDDYWQRNYYEELPAGDGEIRETVISITC